MEKNVFFGKKVIFMEKNLCFSEKKVSKKYSFNLKLKTLKSNLEFTLLEYLIKVIV